MFSSCEGILIHYFLMIYDTYIDLLLNRFCSAQTVKIYFRDNHKCISHLKAASRVLYF